MVEIISKRNGPRREDVQIKQLIEQNRATITRIADHISGGSYSAGKTARQARKPEGQGRLMIHTGPAARPSDDVAPTIRISLNGRVVVMDGNSGRQLHHLGEVRSRDGGETFVLATKDNGFFALVDESIAARLSGIDGTRLGPEYGEEQLAADIDALLHGE